MWERDWQSGLRYFRRGNFFAARDRWQLAADRARSVRERVISYNGLGTVYHRIRGDQAARPYFERAVEWSKSLDPADPIRMKCLANLAQILVRLGLTDVAVRFGQEACKTVSPRHGAESVMALQAYVFALIRSEAYQEVLHLRERCLEAVSWLPDHADPPYHQVVFYHNLGFAALALGRLDEALDFYLRAYGIRKTPETLGELARVHLLRGEADQALAYAGGLLDAVWQFAIFNEKPELAYSAALMAALAYHAGRRDLYRRFVEKAELYFGQVNLWGEWARTQDSAALLGPRDLSIPPDVIDWRPWQTLLDDLSLMDSLETMFPRLYHLSRLAAGFAVRVWQRLDPEDGCARTRDLQVAGRLAYLGLTVQTADEPSAWALLKQPDTRPQMAALGCRLLQAYPHTGPYQRLLRLSLEGLRAAGASGQAGAEREERAAECLGIALHYVESVEVAGRAHNQVMHDISALAGRRFHGEVVSAFAAQCGD
ncbi:MAG: tetratricopeptide repeat protein [Alicyclobacillus sp.]|nr:tetratricopeptide repeat protein [Alicyclobacillus sp.]